MSKGFVNKFLIGAVSLGSIFLAQQVVSQPTINDADSTRVEQKFDLRVDVYTRLSNGKDLPTIITTEKTDYIGFDKYRELYYTGLDGYTRLCFQDTGTYLIKVFTPSKYVLEQIAYTEGRYDWINDPGRLEDHLYNMNRFLLETEINIKQEHFLWGYDDLEFTIPYE